jgi:hypothetical protein
MDPPLGKLAYLDVGTAGFDRDAAYYEQVLGATRVWAFNAFGANGPCRSLTDPSGNPYVLLPNDRPDAMERADTDPANQNAIRGT